MTRTEVTPELEAVARALARSRYAYLREQRSGITDSAFDELIEDRWNLEIPCARAALLAIREPTEAMQNTALVDTGEWLNFATWTAAIDYITGGEK